MIGIKQFLCVLCTICSVRMLTFSWSGIFTILDRPCYVLAMISHASNNKFGISDHFSSKSLSVPFLHAVVRWKGLGLSGHRVLWSSLRLPPGVDRESKLSNMSVFDFALLDSTKLSWSLVKRTRIKQTWDALSFTPTPPRSGTWKLIKQHVCFWLCPSHCNEV